MVPWMAGPDERPLYHTPGRAMSLTGLPNRDTFSIRVVHHFETIMTAHSCWGAHNEITDLKQLVRFLMRKTTADDQSRRWPFFSRTCAAVLCTWILSASTIPLRSAVPDAAPDHIVVFGD